MALLIILALVVGEGVRRWLRLPRVLGPMLVGALASPAGLNLFSGTDLDPWKPLLDLAMGVLVFELGSRAHPRWLLANPWLAVTSIAEGLLSFAAVSATLIVLGAPPLSAAFAGAAAMASSPVLTLCVVHELNPRGQVTERLMLMTAVNSVLAVLAVKAWGVLAAADPSHAGTDVVGVLSNALFVLGGSFLLGLAAGALLDALSRFGVHGPSMELLQMAVVLMASMLASQWKLSALLTLLITGGLARWRMGHRLTVNPQLGSAGGALSMLLLVSLGVLSTLDQVLALWPWVVGLILARGLAKVLTLLVLAKPSALGLRQSLGLGLALQPMSTLAVLLTADTFGWPSGLPQPDAAVLQALLIATTLLQWTGPVLLQWGLGKVADELPHAPKEG
jgi:Kef-type K+ transport system membrane component KefB